MPNRRRHIRWGVAGSGDAARRFVQAMEHVSDASVAAVWGRNPQTAAALAKMCGAAHASSLQDLLCASGIDAVYIATLPDSHAELALAALQAGRAVLCEKPVTANERELEEILAFAGEHGLLFMEAMKPPFFPVYRRLREHLRNDSVGRIDLVQSGFATVAPAGHPSWRLEAAGGSLMGIGVYHAFLSVDWMGPADAVQAHGALINGVDAFATVQTEYGSGRAQWFSGLDREASPGAILVGELGSVTMPGAWWRPETVLVRYNDGRLVTLHEAVVGSGFQYETEHFCALLRSGAQQSPVMTHAHSRATMAILDRAREMIGLRFDADG